MYLKLIESKIVFKFVLPSMHDLDIIFTTAKLECPDFYLFHQK